MILKKNNNLILIIYFFIYLFILIYFSTYGFPDFEGDANDYWRVEIIDHDKKDPQSKDRLRTLHSKFRLIHAMEGCALFSHDVKLPEWGWGQQEVTCIKNGKIPKTIWYIESTMSDQCKIIINCKSNIKNEIYKKRKLKKGY